MITDEHEDVVMNLFTGKYDKETALEYMAELECEPTLYFELMEKHHSKYCLPDKTVATITLSMDLGWLKKFPR